MFKKITIIGFGLIGSSLAQAIKAAHPDTLIVCADASEEACDYVMANKLADAATTSLAEAVMDAECVVLSVPMGAMEAVTTEIAPHLAEGAVVTDTGSVKGLVLDKVAPHLPENVFLVPGHPIAGTEHSGPAAGFPELFEGRWCILTPSEAVPIRIVEKVTEMWEVAGARIEIMEPRHHDTVLAITSHLPHLIAYTIVGTATDLERHLQSEVIKFSASGFRDFTRIAASDPVMWRDIFLNNKNAVLDVIQRFSEDLTALQRAIRHDDGDSLYRCFERTRGIRRQVIEAGQADVPEKK